MTASEQMWFLIGIGGFLVFLEGAIGWIVKQFSKLLKRDIPEDIVKIIVGIIIFVIALVYLFTLPST